jgi:hypothetical protein
MVLLKRRREEILKSLKSLLMANATRKSHKPKTILYKPSLFINLMQDFGVVEFTIR